MCPGHSPDGVNQHGNEWFVNFRALNVLWEEADDENHELISLLIPRM